MTRFHIIVLLGLANLLPADDVVITPAKAEQVFEGWGTSLAWSANVVSWLKPELREKFVDLMFSEDKGLGMTIARYNIGSGDNPQHEGKGLHMWERAYMECFEPEPGKW